MQTRLEGNIHVEESRDRSEAAIGLLVGGAPKITSISQKSLSREQGKLASTPATQPSLLRAIPVSGKPGIVRSPYAPSKGELNVRKHKKGAHVRCPFTGKVFVVP